MNKNIGTIDRIIRIIIGITLIAYGILEQSLFGIIGFIPLITATLSWCPLYSLIGMSSCTIKDKNKSDI